MSLLSLDKTVFAIIDNWSVQSTSTWDNKASALIAKTCFAIITARQRSCGKVMFLQLSVILFTGGSASVHAGIPSPPGPARPPPGQWCMLGDTVNKRAVCILLECNLVSCNFLSSKGSFTSNKSRNRKRNFCLFFFNFFLFHFRSM